MQFYSLTSGLNVFIGTCALVILTGSSAGLAMGSFPDAEASTNSASDWFKHRWNMRSLGRGLNMLRLGKRDSISSLRLLKDLPLLRLGSVGGSSSVDGEDVDGAPVVSEQLLALLKEAVAQHAERDETRGGVRGAAPPAATALRASERRSQQANRGQRSLQPLSFRILD
ncbi:hypothetical protein EGW08_018868 [Elysia chlorotica]|uniref:Uncharacterized protein n=1 Tax=Elysia chlorotica TaxID=188477 RepID=A0A3S1AVK6_ELYCH|nr:hypothetical protein EGW08_018868 [Elysia chlorotica]